MQVFVKKETGILAAYFDLAELYGGADQAGYYRRSYGPVQGVDLEFFGDGTDITLAIRLNARGDIDLPPRILRGGPIEALCVLWSFAHLRGATFATKQVLLPDGRTIEVIHLVQFFLNQGKPGVWLAMNKEWSNDWLERVQRGLPGLLEQIPLGTPGPGGIDCFFSDLAEEGAPREEEEDSSFLTRQAYKKPTAEDINKAIQLLLWRCRDAELHKDTPKGKKGYYGLDDWITQADDDMIRELGLWCADIQELNIGTRDS